MLKKIVFILVIIIIIGVFYGLGKQIYESFQISGRLDSEVEEMVSLQKKNSQLKKNLDEVRSINYIEQQARDKLGWSRGGESVMIIPQEEISKVLGVKDEVQKVIEPYWQGWLKLFWK